MPLLVSDEKGVREAVATTMVTGGVLLAVNRIADSSAGVVQRATIVKKSALSNTRSQGDYDRTSLRNTVSVRSWLDEGKLVEVRVVGTQAWRDLKEGDEIAVQTHPGVLGWTWVSPYQPKP